MSVLAAGLLTITGLGVSVAVASGANALATTVYVAAGGSDSANDCAAAASPCATIGYAQTQVATGGTIRISGTLVENVTLSKAVTIDGLGAASPAVIDGNNAGRVIGAFSGDLTLRGLTLTNGLVDGRGAGVASGDLLTLDRVTVSNNTATMDGGGIASYGPLSITDSVVSDNTTGHNGIAINGGGGISMVRGDTVTMKRTRVSGNSTGFGNGGGLDIASRLDGGTATITDSTFDGNASGNYGSALAAPNDALVVRNSTFAANAADFGAIYLFGSGTAWITGTTVTGSDHALFQQSFGAGTVNVASSVFDNTGDECIFGAGTPGAGFASAGYNLFGDGGCVNTSPTDVVGASALGALANNGGPTATQLPSVTSPAVGLVPTTATANGAALCPRKDQRGVAGPVSGQTSCTAGATEPLAGTAPDFTSATSASTTFGSPLTFTVAASGPLPYLSVSAATPLPVGVTFTDNRDGTGTLAGNALSPGSYPLTFVANNGVGGDVPQAFTLTVDKASQAALTLTSVSGTALSALTLTTSGGSGSGAVSYIATDGTATGCSVTSGALSSTTAGTCSVTATKAADADYDQVSSVPTAVTFAKLAQAINFTSTAPVSATVGGTAYPVTATGGGSGNAVAFALDASSTGCALSGSTVTFPHAGTCVVDASQAGNPNYSAAPQVQQTFGVGKAAQAINFLTTAPAGAVVGGTGYTVVALGGASGNAVTYSLDASSTGCALTGSTATFPAAGTCVIDADQAGSADYADAPQVQQSFAVGKGAQAINFTSTAPAAATVGGASYTVTATGGASGNAVTFSLDATSTGCSLAAAVVSFTSAGTCVVDANQAGNANYSAAPQVQQSFGVGKGAQAISFTSTVPAAATVGGASYIVTATGGASGNAVAFSLDATSTGCALSGATVAFPHAGTCVIDANQTGNADYTAAPQVQQSFAVGKAAQAIDFTSTAPAGATAEGSDYLVTATGGASPAAVQFSLDATSTGCALSGATVTFPHAGTCVIDANQAGNADYTAAPQVQQSFAVAKAAQAISFTSTAPSGAVVGGPDYTVAATGGTSGNAVTFSLDGTSTGCSLAGAVVTFTAHGTCVIDADQAGDADHLAAPTVLQSIAVGPGAQTISFTSTAPAAARVGGTSYTVAAVGGPSGNPVTLSLDPTSTGCALSGASVTFPHAGTCVIDANQAGTADFVAASQARQSFVVGKQFSHTQVTVSRIYQPGRRYVRFSVTVTPAVGHVIPQGVVAVRSGGNLLCLAALDSTGHGGCQVRVGRLHLGRQGLYVHYRGSADFFSSTVTRTVTRFHFRVAG